ncbi:beta strand repeat-containing protein, partial [Campylobacter fetus]|uniref:beta strand repeat-containing protein n=1 Tax=Campylobacter fetus TaxID=196 RepID=UPI0008275752
MNVKDIANFEFINFYLSDDAGKSDAILNLTSTSYTDILASKLSIGLIDNGNTPDLKVGSKIILIGKSSDSYTGIPNTVADDSLYKFVISKDGNNIIATLKNEVLVYNPKGTAFEGVTHKSNTTPKDASIGGDDFGKYIAPDSASYNDNVVSIYSTNSDVDNVYGGYSDTEVAERNTVNIYGGTIGRNIYGSYTAYKDKVANRNTINISGGTISHDIYGGFSSSGSAMINTVNISDGTINNNVYGGTGSGEMSRNIINISGGTISKFVFGGSSTGSGSANLNTINISGGTIGKDVYGGYGGNGPRISADSNTINISGGDIRENIYGGYIINGSSVTKNTVTISKNPTSGNPTFGTDTIIYGGHSRDNSSTDVTTGNTLNIKTSNLSVKDIANFENINFYTSQDTTAGETLLNLTSVADVNISNSNIAVGVKQGDTPTLKVGDEITLIDRSGKTINLPTSMMNSAITDMNSSYTFTLGGVPKDTTSTDISKLVAVFGVTTYNPGNVAAANGTIYYSNTAPASGSIKPNSINDNVVSIYSTNSDVDNVYGGYSDTEVAERNTVNIYGGTISRNIYGSYTAYKDKVANRNTINIFGGTISHDIYGGFSFSGSAMINTVNISGGTINNSVYGGTGSGEMSRNTVNISGGAISKFVYGGSSTGSGSANLNIVNISGGTIGKDVYGGYGGNGPNKISADSNTINISGGDIRENIYGGYIINGSSVTKNTVTISKNPTSGNPTFGTNTIIYGGHSRDNSSADVTT